MSPEWSLEHGLYRAYLRVCTNLSAVSVFFGLFRRWPGNGVAAVTSGRSVALMRWQGQHPCQPPWDGLKWLWRGGEFTLRKVVLDQRLLRVAHAEIGCFPHLFGRLT